MDKKKRIIICILVVIILVIACIPFAFADAPAIRKNVIKVNQSTKIESEEEAVEEVKEYKNYYFLGDSRSVGMSSIDDNENHFYIAKVGEGYKYFSNNYESVLKKATKDDIIIINFGVNDLGNSSKYIELINKIAAETKATVAFLTVNPVDEELEAKKGYKVKNADIDSFNEKLKEGLSSNVIIIDSNAILTKEGFKTVDGVHYDNNTYKKILKIATEIKD